MPDLVSSLKSLLLVNTSIEENRQQEQQQIGDQQQSLLGGTECPFCDARNVLGRQWKKQVSILPVTVKVLNFEIIKYTETISTMKIFNKSLQFISHKPESVTCRRRLKRVDPQRLRCS